MQIMQQSDGEVGICNQDTSAERLDTFEARSQIPKLSIPHFQALMKTDTIATTSLQQSQTCARDAPQPQAASLMVLVLLGQTHW